jgi:hypothetical protein
MSETENKKTASERLEDLEKTLGQVIGAIQPLQPLTQDFNGFREALKLLNNKLDAVVKSINAGGPITDDGLSKLMIENNAKELADKVANMVTQGLLVASQTVTKDSFVVVNETDATGTVVNPRMQFLLSALQNEEVRAKLEGSTVGANIPVGDKGASINVLEAYDVSTPQAPAAEAAPAADATAPAAEASAPAADSAPAATDAAPAAAAPAAADAAPATATA